MPKKFVRRLLRNLNLTCKKRRRKRREHINKYKHLALYKILLYDAQNKRFRNLPLTGMPGEVVPEGIIMIYHGRRYRLLSQAKILEDGMGNGEFELCKKSYT